MRAKRASSFWLALSCSLLIDKEMPLTQDEIDSNDKIRCMTTGSSRIHLDLGSCRLFFLG